MNRLLIILSIVFTGLMAFNEKADKEFTIVFTPPQNVNISNFYLDIVTDKLTRDSAVLQDGKAKFTGKIDVPKKARLTLVIPDADGKKRAEFVDVILEPANIVIDASGGFRDVKYAGSKTQQELNEWNAAINPFYKEIMTKWPEVTKYNKAGDKENENKIREDIQALAKKATAAKEKFMLKNSNSLITALMLPDYTTVVWENLAGAEKIYNNLSPQLKELPDLKKFSRELEIALTMAPGKKYPDFTLPDSTGKMVNVSSFKGKYVLIDFWASWCGPCRAESPALVAAYNKYKEKGFDIFSVSFDESTKAWLKAVAKDGYTWANVVDTTGMGPKSSLSAKFNIMAIPRNFLLDKDGKVIATNLRGEGLEKKLAEVFGS